MKEAKPEPTPLERAMRLLARRGHSAAELAAKLRRAGVPPREAAAAVEECRRLGFINDEIYASDCAAMLADRGCGSFKIKLELRKRGVAGHTAEALENLDTSELDRAVEAARYKRRLLTREPDPRKVREKIWRFLISRGFAPGVVRDAAERACRDEEETE